MKFTRGLVYVDNRGATSQAGLKAIVGALVSAIPGLSIDTVTTDSASEYNVTLNYNGVLFGLRYYRGYVYFKVSKSSETSVSNPALQEKAVVTYMYSDTGLLTMQWVSLESSKYQGSVISLIPIEFTLSDGTTKTLYWTRWLGSISPAIGNIAIFPLTSTTYYLVDPDTQNYYDYSISGGNTGPVSQAKGKTVAVPLTFTNSYGEVASYNVVGASSFYYIYPGALEIVKEYYPGSHLIYVGNDAYMAISESYFIRV